MKLLKYIFSATLCTLAMTACTDGYESEPVENTTLDYIFSRTDSMGEKAICYVEYIYNEMKDVCQGHNRVSQDYLDAATDDAISIQYDKSQVYRLQTGQFTAGNMVGSESDIWANCYKCIRDCNIFIANIDVVPFKSTFTNSKGDVLPLNVTLKNEVRFIRALMYFELVKRYGGVPLLGDKIYDISDNMELPRNTFAECVDYIVSEADACAPNLRTYPISDPNQWGHVVVEEACKALKARMLLYAASPLFNGNTIEPGNPLVGYTDYDPKRWELARDAAKDIIDTYGPNGSGTHKLHPTKETIFTTMLSSECLWFVQNERGRGLETLNGPLGFSGNGNGNGRTIPSQALVDAFPMADGLPAGDPSSQYQTYDPLSQTQYDNRDPRLDLTVLHNGSPWLGTKLNTCVNGTHNPTSNAIYSRTSYYMRKFMANYATTSASASREYADAHHPWIMFRYAEVLLNFAEASNECDDAIRNADLNEVLAGLTELRKRAGVKKGTAGDWGVKATMNRDEMREYVRNERRIEMAFEEQRYYDIRRWRIAEVVMNKPIMGVRIVNQGGVYNFTPVTVLDMKWDNRRYFHPIPYSEVLKNSNMVQNPNW